MYIVRFVYIFTAELQNVCLDFLLTYVRVLHKEPWPVSGCPQRRAASTCGRARWSTTPSSASGARARRPAPSRLSSGWDPGSATAAGPSSRPGSPWNPGRTSAIILHYNATFPLPPLSHYFTSFVSQNSISRLCLMSLSFCLVQEFSMSLLFAKEFMLFRSV